jgi:hypothetical protein
MEGVFMLTVKLLSAKGYLKLENYFVDGTKIESAANKYTFVWKRAMETNDRKLDMKLRAFLKEIDRVRDEENFDYGERDLEEMGEPSDLYGQRRRLAGTDAEHANQSAG